MVKLCCDRCGKEITEKHYYIIGIYKMELSPKNSYSIIDCADAISSYSNVLESSPYDKLNSQVMYCNECKNQIEAFINNLKT